MGSRLEFQLRLQSDLLEVPSNLNESSPSFETSFIANIVGGETAWHGSGVEHTYTEFTPAKLFSLKPGGGVRDVRRVSKIAASWMDDYARRPRANDLN